MKNPGPVLEALTHRLADTPAEFLAEPRIGETGTVSVPALVHDLMEMLGCRANPDALRSYQGGSLKADRNRLALVMITAWLLADEWFVSQSFDARALHGALGGGTRELAAVTPAHQFVQEPDRREELVRHVLAKLGFRPAGESEKQAIDRMSSVSGEQRKRLLQASRAAEQRAREIRAALAKKAAEESADKWSRE